MNSPRFVEYLWIDGTQPTQQIRSKARLVSLPKNRSLEIFPSGVSMAPQRGQADGHYSDCLLNPVRVYRDPFRGAGNYLVLCEVNEAGGTTHEFNWRARFRALLNAGGEALDPWLGFEQEYTLPNSGCPVYRCPIAFKRWLSLASPVGYPPEFHGRPA